MMDDDIRELREGGDPLSGTATCREDALPEYTRYRDEGCELSPSCLQCTLPACRYDYPCGVRRLRNLNRDEEIARLRCSDRLPIDMLARRFRVSRRTVFRILKRCASGNGVGGNSTPA